MRRLIALRCGMSLRGFIGGGLYHSHDLGGTDFGLWGGGLICRGVPPWAPALLKVGNKAGAHGGTPLQIRPLPSVVLKPNHRLKSPATYFRLKLLHGKPELCIAHQLAGQTFRSCKRAYCVRFDDCVSR